MLNTTKNDMRAVGVGYGKLRKLEFRTKVAKHK